MPEDLVSEEVGAALITTVDRALRRQGFWGPCRDNLLQDIVLWLLRKRGFLAEFPPGETLVAVLASRFLRTKNARRYEVSRLEPSASIASLAQQPCTDPGVAAVEARLDAEALPSTAGRLLRLVLQGFTWAEACGELHVAVGSRSFLRKQVRTRF